jgi:hypothetical protein
MKLKEKYAVDGEATKQSHKTATSFYITQGFLFAHHFLRTQNYQAGIFHQEFTLFREANVNLSLAHKLSRNPSVQLIISHGIWVRLQ